MAYTPDPTDPTEPVDGRDAGTAAAEFRALKEYLQTVTINAGKSGTVRQTVLQGPVDANGNAALMSAGTGLGLNLLATARAVVLTFAQGFSPTLGNVDSYTQISNDVNDFIVALPASNTSYIGGQFTDTFTMSWENGLIPPQYGYAFDRTRGGLMNFEGADASTTMLDDFGNTWTAVANAQIDTAQFKFGASSLLLDGTGDYIESTNYTTLGPGSWEESIWFRLNATSVIHAVIACENATGFGAILSVDHNAGSRRVRVDLSSTGAADDIANGTLGTTALNLATWYKARMVFDALAGTYRVYLSNNGAAETQEISVSSTARIGAITRKRLGHCQEATFADFNGWLDAYRGIIAATATSTETPAAVAPAITNHKYNWFSLSEMRMYEVTVASGTAGTNPTMAAKRRLYIGEVDTSGAGIAAIRSYAYQGMFTSLLTAVPAVSTATSVNHNLGILPLHQLVKLVNVTTEGGYIPGDVVFMTMEADSAPNFLPLPAIVNSRSISTVRSNTASRVLNKTTGALVTITAASWKYQFEAHRGW